MGKVKPFSKGWCDNGYLSVENETGFLPHTIPKNLHQVKTKCTKQNFQTFRRIYRWMLLCFPGWGRLCYQEKEIQAFREKIMKQLDYINILNVHAPEDSVLKSERR